MDAASPAKQISPRPADLESQLGKIIGPSRVLTHPTDLIAFAADASFYRLVPKAVVLARGADEVDKLFRFSHQHRIPLTFRAAGTSLSGQAVTDGILVEVARYWKLIKVEEEGRTVRVQPGAIGAHVNIALRPYRTKMGPDPASINACMMGGILANNSSGMCCGVAQNAYHTLSSLTFMLPSGTMIDTADPGADELLRRREPGVAAGLIELKRDIESRPALRDRIRAKYKSKNTTGYSLNAFIDFERPVDILRHVLIGSEGTLAFTAEAVLNTVPDLPVKYTGLLLFPNLHAACAAIVPLRDAGAAALELMDRASLRSVEDQAGVPAGVKKLSDRGAGLLAEFQSARTAERPRLEQIAHAAVAGLHLVEPPLFTHEPCEQAALWKIRAGMFPSVGAVRKSGTTVIIEDVAFPIDKLADAAVDLTRLFQLHGYDNAIIFGHAKDGNLHFVITQSFNDQAAIDQYARFMDDVIKLVVERYDGALKAEHGTGRNMAPFVETEWGAEVYAVMKRLKRLCDPEGLLNPGVIINSDPKAHLAGLKPLPSVEEEVDRVRLLRIEVPESRTDDHAAPAHRSAARDRAPQSYRPGPRALGRPRGELPLLRAGDLRCRRPVRNRLPGLNRHGPVDQALAQAEPQRQGTPPGAMGGGALPLVRSGYLARPAHGPFGPGGHRWRRNEPPRPHGRRTGVEQRCSAARTSAPEDGAPRCAGGIFPELHFSHDGSPAR
jgi:D-lactate dehydrogenase